SDRSPSLAGRRSQRWRARVGRRVGGAQVRRLAPGRPDRAAAPGAAEACLPRAGAPGRRRARLPSSLAREDQLLSAPGLGQRARRAWKEAGLQPITLQEARHTAATWLG